MTKRNRIAGAQSQVESATARLRKVEREYADAKSDAVASRAWDAWKRADADLTEAYAELARAKARVY